MANIRNIYADGLVINYPEGDKALERIPLSFENDLEDISHTVIEGDTLLSLAQYYFKDSRVWWKIADRNLILNPFVLEVNTEIIIPNPKSIR